MEVTLNTELVSTDDMHWTLGYNASYNKNEVTKLTANGDPDYYVAAGGLGCSTWKYSGTESRQSKIRRSSCINKSMVTTVVPLRDVFVDRNNDGLINESDRYIYRNRIHR